MRRVCTGAQLSTFGTPSAASGTPGYFNPAAPGLGVVPTPPGPDWFNTVQEELVALLTAVSGVLDTTGTSNAQVLTSLKRLFGGNYLYVTADTTLTADNLGFVVINATAGNVTVTLPAAAAIDGTVAGSAVNNPPRLRVYRNDATANTVTVQRAGSDTIDCPGGNADSVLLPGFGGWEMFADGLASWFAAAFGPQPHGSAFSETAGAWNWTCPAGVYFVEAEGWDAGAGGQGAPSATGGQGGGGGGYFKAVVPVAPGTVYANQVGVGGVSGAGGSGAVGSSPAYGTTLLFGGGSATFAGNAKGGGTVTPSGGSPPTVTGLTGGTYVAAGGAQGWSQLSGSGGPGGGNGAGAAGGSFATASGDPGVAPGCGGGGAGSGSGDAGAAGQNGAIYLRW